MGAIWVSKEAQALLDEIKKEMAEEGMGKRHIPMQSCDWAKIAKLKSIRKHYTALCSII